MNPVPLFLLAISLPLLLGGCGEKAILDSVNYDELEERESIIYRKGSDTPYTGKVYELHPNGQKGYEGKYKDGLQEGLIVMWYESGQKRGEVNFFSGKVMSAKVWKPNGEKCPVSNLKDGNGVLLGYNEDGTEKFRQTFKEGQVVED